MQSKWILSGIIYNQEMLANTSALAEYLLHCLEHATRGIGFYVNTDKTVFVL